MNDQKMKINIYRSSSDDESTTEDIASDEDDDDFEEENNCHINEGIERTSEDSDEETDSQSMDEGADSQSMDEESDDVSFDLAYRQNEAMEKLSTVFRLFNIDPIHDK
jgi:hypothetical protein